MKNQSTRRTFRLGTGVNPRKLPRTETETKAFEFYQSVLQEKENK